jgi:Circularly permutated YpsA SLOG family
MLSKRPTFLVRWLCKPAPTGKRRHQWPLSGAINGWTSEGPSRRRQRRSNLAWAREMIANSLPLLQSSQTSLLSLSQSNERTTLLPTSGSRNLPMPRIKIISGGQTGVDRGALDAALACGVACGGWCPEGRMAEDGKIPARYPVTVLAGGGYRERTRQNVIDSDGTVIIYFEEIEPRSGTELTVNECIAASRPHLLIDGHRVPVMKAAHEIGDFCRRNAVARLNVAGPRSSSTPSAHVYTQRVIQEFLGLWLER